MNPLPIDVDAEAIFFDGAWYTREDLGRKIKSMIDGGDFNVARPSAALEALSATLSQVRTLSFRVTPDLAAALEQLANRSGNSVGQLVREAVMQMLTQGAAAPQEALRQGDAVKAAAPTPPDAAPTVIVKEEPVVMAGPGALRNAGIDPKTVQPIELTKRVEPQPQPQQPQSQNEENRWFKQ